MRQEGVLVSLDLLERESRNSDVHPLLRIKIVEEVRVEMSSSLIVLSNQIFQ
jgi:hypothetical protein